MSLLLWHVPGTFYEPEDVEIGILDHPFNIFFVHHPFMRLLINNSTHEPSFFDPRELRCVGVRLPSGWTCGSA